jgi:hypothetical protein
MVYTKKKRRYKMKINNVKDYQKTKDVNSKDSYSKGILDYLERWADLMESRMILGENVQDIADETSHTADTDGITGFMYNMAVKILAQYWVYGEELRVWHNKEYDYEGKGIVNSAILTMRTE